MPSPADRRVLWGIVVGAGTVAVAFLLSGVRALEIIGVLVGIAAFFASAMAWAVLVGFGRPTRERWNRKRPTARDDDRPARRPPHR